MKHTYPIFIADENEALLDGLVSIISQEQAFEVIGTARSRKELEAKALACSSNVFLLDMDLAYPDESGLPECISERTDGSKIIILTEHWEHSLIKRIMASGVKGCLRKSCDAIELIYAIHSVVGGKSYISGFHNADIQLAEIENEPIQREIHT